MSAIEDGFAERAMTQRCGGMLTSALQATS